MRFAEALTALIDQQYTQDAESSHKYGWPQSPITEFADDSTNITISRIVGDIVDKATEGAIDFGTFDNCREYGVTFTYGLWTFCVYEHRNSDEIHIEGCPTAEIQSWGPYGGVDKWDTLFCADAEEYAVVAEKVIAMLHLVSDGNAHSRDEVRAASLSIASTP